MRTLLIFCLLLVAGSCCMSGVGQIELYRAADCPWQLAGAGTAFPICSTWNNDRGAFEIFMLTAGHVAQGLTPPFVASHRDGRTLVAQDPPVFHPHQDVALICFLSPEPVEVLKVDPRPVRYGEHVLIPGYQGLKIWIVEGVASDSDRCSAPMFGGGSGSPVLDQAGRVRGIVVSIAGFQSPQGVRLLVYHHCTFLPLYRINPWLESMK